MLEDHETHVVDFANRCQVFVGRDSTLPLETLELLIPAHVPCRAICMGVLFEALQRGLLHGHLSAGALLRFVYTARPGAPRDPNVSTKNRDVLESALHYIRANAHCGPVSLDSVARHCGISKYQLSRIFHAELHEGLLALVRSRRLEFAMNALLTTTESIKAIAFTSGFRSATQFCTCFRRTVGCTPSEFRTGTSGTGAKSQ